MISYSRSDDEPWSVFWEYQMWQNLSECVVQESDNFKMWQHHSIASENKLDQNHAALGILHVTKFVRNLWLRQFLTIYELLINTPQNYNIFGAPEKHVWNIWNHSALCWGPCPPLTRPVNAQKYTNPCLKLKWQQKELNRINWPQEWYPIMCRP